MKIEKDEDCGGSPHLFGVVVFTIFISCFSQNQQQAQGYEELFIGFFPEEQEQQQ